MTYPSHHTSEFGASLESHFVKHGNSFDFDLSSDDGGDAVFLPPRLRTDAEYDARDQKFKAASNKKQRPYHVSQRREEHTSPSSAEINWHSMHLETFLTPTEFTPGDVFLRKQTSRSMTDGSTGCESSPMSQNSSCGMHSRSSCGMHSRKSTIRSQRLDDSVNFPSDFWLRLEKYRSP